MTITSEYAVVTYHERSEKRGLVDLALHNIIITLHNENIILFIYILYAYCGYDFAFT